jgi:hypothetical protein
MNISPKLPKRISMSIALFTVMSMAIALAQTSTPDAPITDPDRGETNTMDRYLNNHPRAAQELHDNPSLINNPQWLANHPSVQNYMNSHPALKADAADHPSEFVHGTEHHDLMVDHKALNRTDAFMHDHPQVASELRNDPKLIDDPKYLAQHPELNSYLDKHPELKSEWQKHPEAFTKAAEKNARYDENHRPPKPVATGRK